MHQANRVPGRPPLRDVARTPRTEAENTALARERRECERLLRTYHRTRDLRLRNEIVLRHTRLVRFLAGRFSPGEAVTSEDLLQVGYIGLIAAIERYDPDLGLSFTSFAMPTIVGVIKHYLRDHTWFVYAPRRLRELANRIRVVRLTLEQELGRSPTTAELARAVEAPEERVIEAMEVDLLYYPVSLDSRTWEDDDRSGHYLDAIGTEEPAFESLEIRETIAQALSCLDERERRIIQERFFGEATQGEVAAKLGISQMHVSRLERRALSRLRALLT